MVYIIKSANLTKVLFSARFILILSEFYGWNNSGAITVELFIARSKKISHEKFRGVNITAVPSHIPLIRFQVDMTVVHQNNALLP